MVKLSSNESVTGYETNDQLADYHFAKNICKIYNIMMGSLQDIDYNKTENIQESCFRCTTLPLSKIENSNWHKKRQDITHAPVIQI